MEYEATLTDAGFPSEVFNDRRNTIQGRLNARENEDLILVDIKDKVKNFSKSKATKSLKLD